MASTVVDPRAARLASRASLALAATTFAAGLLATIGWATGITALARIVPGLQPMPPNVALALVALGAALALVSRAPTTRARRLASAGLALVAVALGALTVVEYATARDLGLDALAARAPTGLEPAALRMGSDVALSLILVGLAVVLLDARLKQDHVMSEAFALAAGIFQLFAAIGAAYHVTPAAPAAAGAGGTGSVQAAAGIVALAGGILFARPARGLGAIVTSASAGGLMARRLLVAAVLVPVALGWVLVEAEGQGYLARGYGMSLFAIATIVIFSVLILWNADALNSTDAERRRAEARLRAEAKFRALIEAAPDAILIAGRDGRIALANSKSESLFGIQRGELLGAPVDSLLPLTGLPTTEPRAFEILARRRDGGDFPVEVRLSPMESEDGVIVTYVVRDVTERRRAEEERLAGVARLKELERLKELDRFKTEFINTAAHELGTPLTPIRLQLHLLKTTRSQNLTDGQRKSVDILDRNIERLAQLIADMLDVARLQASRLGVTKRRMDLNRTIVECVESFQEPARRNGVALEARLAPAAEIEADPTRLGQVIFNLVSNAVKFTPHGGRITVETAIVGDAATVRVVDTGAGLAPEQIARLFQPFSQVHDKSVSPNGGTGLGLYISRGLVELHGGKLWCESAGPGKGSTFAFVVPVQAAPELPAELLAKPAAAARSRTASEPARDSVARRAKELI